MTLKGSALQPAECAVIFDVSDEGVGVKLIKNKEIQESYFNRWSSAELEADVQKFRKPFEQPNLRDFDPELGKTLYKKLLSRVVMDLPPGTR